jgi:hypothetical protein
MVPAHDPLSITAQMARMDVRLMINEAKRHGVDPRNQAERQSCAALGSGVARAIAIARPLFLDPFKRAKARPGRPPPKNGRDPRSGLALPMRSDLRCFGRP